MEFKAHGLFPALVGSGNFWNVNQFFSFFFRLPLWLAFLIHITHFFCGGVGWGGREVGAIHFLLGTESLLVMDCECNNTLVCTLVPSAQIFLFFKF